MFSVLLSLSRDSVVAQTRFENWAGSVCSQTEDTEYILEKQQQLYFFFLNSLIFIVLLSLTRFGVIRWGVSVIHFKRIYWDSFTSFIAAAILVIRRFKHWQHSLLFFF